ncbi:MAG: hypothetical protein ACRCWI_04460 [Brevinema sp.]
MKIFLLLLLFYGACTPKINPTIQEELSYIELDQKRMEQIVVLMPVILQKSEEFKSIASQVNMSDEDYNTRFYQYLFQEKTFAERLNKAGFQNIEEYQSFYTVMIEMYLLLLKQPEVIESAKQIIPIHEKEIKTFILRQAQEPNNKELTRRLDRLNYELAGYKNLLLVNQFLDQLNSLNQS